VHASPEAVIGSLQNFASLLRYTPSFWRPAPSCEKGWLPSLQAGASALSGQINLDRMGLFADSLVIFVVNTKGGAHSAIKPWAIFLHTASSSRLNLEVFTIHSSILLFTSWNHASNISCANSDDFTIGALPLSHHYTTILSTALCLTPPHFEVKLWYPTRY